MNTFDSELLKTVECGIPLIHRPYDQIALQLGASVQQVIDRLAELRRPGGVIRRIGGVFDAAAMGYQQALIALRIRSGELDAAGAIAAEHPGVSHCYGRSGAYNLWFTLAVSPQSGFGLEKTADKIARACKAAAKMVLPSIKRYKLRVALAADPSDIVADDYLGAVAAGDEILQDKPTSAPDEKQIVAIHALQADLPADAEPFDTLGRKFNIDPSQLLLHAENFLKLRWMRRYSATLRHHAVGYSANVLVAWRANSENVDSCGAAMSASPAVSHCYLRPASADWPYSLYTMIHGKSRPECILTIGQLAMTTGINERAELWTTAEYKKQPIRLFDEEEAWWEKINAQP